MSQINGVVPLMSHPAVYGSWRTFVFFVQFCFLFYLIVLVLPSSMCQRTRHTKIRLWKVPGYQGNSE